jgi:hypothetical protein
MYGLNENIPLVIALLITVTMIFYYLYRVESYIGYNSLKETNFISTPQNYQTVS